MPAKCLPRFKKLPMELQDMVWLSALDDPLLEIFVCPGTGQFEASISKLAIMAYGRIYPVKPGLLPIYLTVNKEWTAREPKQKSLKKKKGKASASYGKKELEDTSRGAMVEIMTQDMIYLPEIYKMDCPAFLAKDENLAIDKLAINSILRILPRNEEGPEQPIGSLICHLQISKLHVVEVRVMEDELLISRQCGYHLELWNVLRGRDGDTVTAGEVIKRPRPHPWSSGVALSIEKFFDQ